MLTLKHQQNIKSIFMVLILALVLIAEPVLAKRGRSGQRKSGKKMKIGLIFRRGRKRSGFTLIELLVVISIIALLLGILIPVSSKTKEKNREVLCANNLKQSMLITRMYTSDFNGRLPGMWPDLWYKLYNPYSGYDINYSKGSSSSSVVTTGKSSYDLEDGLGVGYLRCPSAKDAKRTYAANFPIICHEAKDKNGYTPYSEIHGSANLDKVPSKIFIYGDHWGKKWVEGEESISAVIFHPVGWPFDHDENGNNLLDSSFGELTTYGPYNGWRPRHSGAGNMVYADGSAKRMKMEEWEDAWVTYNGTDKDWGFWGTFSYDMYR